MKKQNIMDAYYADYMNNKYDEYKNLEDGMAIVRIGGKWGYLNADGELIADGLDAVEPFIDGWALARVYEGDVEYLFINKAGHTMNVHGIGQKNLTCAERFKNGKALIQINCKDWYVIDRQGCVLTDSFENYHIEVEDDENFLYIFKDNAWGILNRLEGRIVVPCIFNRDDDGLEEFDVNKRLAVVSIFHRHNDDDRNGIEVYRFFNLDSGETPVDYFDDYEWQNDKILIKIDNMWGCLNTGLQYIVMPTYTDKQEVIDELEMKQTFF